MCVCVAGFVQFLQYYYQSGCLYRLRALGERNQLDLTVGELYTGVSVCGWGCARGVWVCSVGMRSGLCLNSSSPTLADQVFYQSRCLNRSVVVLDQAWICKVGVKGVFTATAYKSILSICVLLISGNKLNESPYMCVMIRCPRVFNHIVHM